jgi:hypothetical protein
MRLFFGVALAATLFSSMAPAQRTMGYWFLAPGALTSGGDTSFRLQLGAGGDFRIWNGISAGIEGGAAVAPNHHFIDKGVGIASANGYYHFFHSTEARFDPFVTTGYSLFVRNGTMNRVNYGAGINYWAFKHTAIRMELRDHLGYHPTQHLWGLRVGVSFTQLWP